MSATKSSAGTQPLLRRCNAIASSSGEPASMVMNISDQHNISSVHCREEHDILETARRLEGGMRFHGEGFHRSAGDAPVVTVVTVVRNGESFLERTIQSVVGQMHGSVELIIIDGSSTDGTLDIIRRYDQKIAYWLSEPDKGIYDAMNKGIDYATGEWIIFLNAGDEFADDRVLTRVIPELRTDVDVLYGRHEEVYGYGYTRTPALGNLRDLWKGMVFSHQSMLVRAQAMKRTKFDGDNRIAADYEFIYRLYTGNCRFYAVDRVISRVIADGFSAANNIELIRQQWRIARRFSGRHLVVDCYYLGSLVSVWFKNALKRLLPQRIVSRLRSLRDK